jgi:hypothetical protein
MTVSKRRLGHIVLVVGLCFGFCGRYIVSAWLRVQDDRKAQQNGQFSPEAGRAALTNLLQDDPDTFVNKLDARDDAHGDLFEQSDDKFLLGKESWRGFTIDVAKREYRLIQIPGADGGKFAYGGVYHEYSGLFEFVAGRWLAKKPTIFVGKIS